MRSCSCCCSYKGQLNTDPSMSPVTHALPGHSLMQRGELWMGQQSPLMSTMACKQIGADPRTLFYHPQGNEQGPPHRSTPTQTMPQPCALHSTSCWAAALPGQRQPMAGGCCLMAGPLEAQVPPMPGANTAACTAEEARVSVARW